MSPSRKELRDRTLKWTFTFVVMVWIASAIVVILSKEEPTITEPSVITVEELPPIRAENK